MPTDTSSTAEQRELLTRIQSLFDDCLFVQAFHAGAPLGPLHEWPSTEGRILAARLASQLSADRLSDAMLLRAWRRDRDNPHAQYYAAFALQSSRGLLAALDHIEKSGLLQQDSPVRWNATSYAAYLYACYRDFETADRLIKDTLAHTDEAWAWAQLANIHEMADRYDEALDAARHALVINPRSRMAIQNTARILSYFERDAEAIELLRDSLKSIESTRLAGHLSRLEVEQGQYQAALATLDRFEQLALVRDRDTLPWLANRRCDIYSHLGDHARALEQARLSKAGFYQEVARRLEQAGKGGRRVMLPVGFVRQHHMTCAPATLAALSRYWSLDTDHLSLADEICYDGTPNQSQRRWALENGWEVREFTADWDSARALLDAGIPFTLSTVHPGSAHLQAVIGYDDARGVLFIRDPYERIHTEFAEEPFFKSYAATGPRGMAMVPLAERARLDAITLPDAELYDLAYDVQAALLQHDRNRAAEQLAMLERQAPGHRITLSARRSLANYDGDSFGVLAVVEQLLERYPEDVNLRLSKADLLQQLATHEHHLNYIRGEVEGTASHSLLELRLAQLQLEDGRTRDEAVRRLQKLVRRNGGSNTLSTLADAHWKAAEYPRSLFLYRLASTNDETAEGHARTYFRTARLLHDEARALEYLRTRVERLGKRSPIPAITLIDSLDDLERTREAAAVMDEVLAQHPEDGELLLFAARMCISFSNRAKSEELLQRARSFSKPNDWLRAAARLADSQGHLDEALRLWGEVVTSDPLDTGAQRAMSRLLAETQGRAATLQHLREQVERFPHHQVLNELLVDWMDEEPLAEQEAALRKLISVSPSNAWAQRQLALLLARQQRFAEAHTQLEIARSLAPEAVTLQNTVGHIAMLEGHLPEARTAFRAALKRDIDSDYAIDKLIEACGDLEERRTELGFVLDEMKRQIVSGDCLLNFQRLAGDTLPPETLAAELETARSIRSDLWQAWTACARQQMAMEQPEAARELLRQAIELFPLLPRLHVELAECERLLGDRGAECNALREALRINPGWGYAARKLADALEADGDFAASASVLESALRHSPADPLLHGYLAHALWQQGEQEAAVAQLEKAVQLDPGYAWAWETLHNRCETLGRPDAALQLARKISSQRSGEMRIWMSLARVTDDDSEKLAALDRAIALAPLDLDPHLMKLDLLISRKRYDEALAALRNTAWGDRPPVALRIKEPRLLEERGDAKGAISRLKEILADDPNYYPGWELLADWHEERKEYEDYLKAAREMVRIAPNNAYAIGYLADAQGKAEPDSDIRPHLRRAQQLRPDYRFAALELFDREFAAKDLDAAEQALDIFAPHSTSGWLQWRRIRLALQRGQHEQARELMQALWQHEDEDVELFRSAMEALDNAGLGQMADNQLERVVRDPATNPAAGTLWVERRARASIGLFRFYGIGRLLQHGAVGQHAAQALLRHYVKTKDKIGLHLLLRRHIKVLKQDDTTHGLIAYALTEIGKPRDTLKYFGDWRQRPSAPPWALLNLGCALRGLGRFSDANEVSRHAVTLRPDHTFSHHHILLAYDAARAERYSDAEKMLDMANEPEAGSYYQFIACATRAVLAGCRDSSRENYARARFEIGRAQRLMPKYTFDEGLRRSLWGAMWQIARARNSHPVIAPLYWLRLALA